MMDLRGQADTRQGSPTYDPELVKYEVLEICDYYLRERRKEGRRFTYRCPGCGGRRFEVEPVRAMAGCFSAECGLPKTTDALGIIAYMERLDTRGPGFIECLKKGYDILGLETGEDASPSSGSGDREGYRKSPRKRSWVVGEASPNQSQADDLADPASSATDQANSEQTRPGRLIEAYTELPDGSRERLEAFVIDDDTGEIRITPGGEGMESQATAGAVAIADSEATPPSSASGAPTPARRERVEDHPGAGGDQDLQRGINHKVFERLLLMCRLEDRDREFLMDRGLDEAAIEEGHFGSISKKRSRYVTERLEKRFPDEELLSVPGFYRAETGQLRFTLYGDYALIPYYDRDGYICTVEGCLTGEPSRKDDPKYKALAGSGVHLYVHPRFDPGEVVAFCEGAIGAMVAARCGIPVAAIKGMRNYRQPPEGRHDDYSILPQLAGVDFAGKEIVYIPDVDVKPKTREEALGIVPEACEWLIERQGGRAKVALLPEGAKDLDEWLLSLAEEDRVPEFMKLLRGAVAVEQWDPEQLPGERGADAKDTGEEIVEKSNPESAKDQHTNSPESESANGPGEAPEGYDTRAANEAGQPPSQGENNHGLSTGGKYRKTTLLGHHIQVRQTTDTGDPSEQAENAQNLPAEIGAEESKESGEKESPATNEGAADSRTGRRHEGSESSEEQVPEPGNKSRMAASHPSMAFWYETQQFTQEQLEEKKAEATERRRLRERHQHHRSRAVHLPKWNAGELAIALVVSVIAGAVIVGALYLAGTQEGIVGSVGALLTWPVWWIELVLCWCVGLLAADWVVKVRYRMRKRQLADHVGAPRRSRNRRA
jgi:hypothetical protein